MARPAVALNYPKPRPTDPGVRSLYRKATIRPVSTATLALSQTGDVMRPSETWGEQDCINNDSATRGSASSNARAIRVIKILRILRIARVLKLVKFIT